MASLDHQAAVTIIEHCLQAFQAGAVEDAHFSAFEAALTQLAADEARIVRYYVQAGEALFSRSRYDKASQYLEQGLGLARSRQDLPSQALALGALAEIDRLHGHYRDAFSRINNALAILDKTHDQPVRARILILAGLNDISLAAYDSAQERFEEAYQLYRKLDDNHGLDMSLIRLGTVTMMTRKYAVAEKWLKEALVLCSQINDQHGLAGALINLGEVYRVQGNSSAAYQHCREAGLTFARLGLTRGVAIAENNMGHLMVAAGYQAQARAHYSQAFEIANRDTLTPELLDTLAGLVLILVRNGSTELASRMAATIINHPARLDETYQLLEPILPQVIDRGQSQTVSVTDPATPPLTLQQLFDQAMLASSALA